MEDVTLVRALDVQITLNSTMFTRLRDFDIQGKIANWVQVTDVTCLSCVIGRRVGWEL